MIKRAFDITLSAFGLTVVAPLFAVVAVVIRCTSRGPVFFRQERIGRGFRPFYILKFRTMVPDAPKLGGVLTCGDDPRITRIGRFLRMTKLDELPQLINVLRGDMSFVGPRPQTRRYVEIYPKEYEQLLTVRPGITDLASLKYRHEAELLGQYNDPEAAYINLILPDKLALGREYIARSSLAFDLKLIFMTVFRMAEPAKKQEVPMMRRRRLQVTKAMLVRMLADAALVNVAMVGALAVRLLLAVAFQGRNGSEYGEEFWGYACGYFNTGWLLTVISICLFALHGVYTYGRNYQGRYKALVIAESVSQSYLVYALLTYLVWDKFGMATVPRGALVLAWVFNLGLTLAARTWTFVWEKVIRPEREVLVKLRESSGRNVLVIGGAGYIGSALLPKLLNAGFRVRVLDLFLYGNEPIRQVEGHPALELVPGDFRQVQKVVEAMRGMDAVIHLGAIVGDPACDLDENVTLTVNLSATQMIAQVAKASGIRRFIFASTCSVYQACDVLLDERSEVQPTSLYGQTKLAAERGLQKMADEGFAPTILRFATLYGLSGRTRFDLVVNLLVARAKMDGRITVNDGRQWRPFVHVDDAANAVFTVLKAPLEYVGNETFNVGSDEQNKTIQQIGEVIREQVIAAELIVNKHAADQRNYRVSFAKIRNRLGFRPNWTLEQGVGQVLETVANGDIRDYKDAKYSNAKFLSESGAIEIVRADDDDWARELVRPRAEPEFAA